MLTGFQRLIYFYQPSVTYYHAAVELPVSSYVTILSIQLNLLHKPNYLSNFIVPKEKEENLIVSFKTAFCSGFDSGKDKDLELQKNIKSSHTIK